MNNDCIFCKIANGEIPSYKVYEDENTFVFLDIANDFYGHTLVIPKKHVKSIVEADEKTMLNVFKTVQLISNHYIKNCGFSGVNIVNNCGESAGQTVMHFHIHIFPRKENDLGEVGWKQENISELKLDDLIKQLKYTKK